MSPKYLRKFVSRRPTGAIFLQLVFVSGEESTEPVYTWDEAQLEGKEDLEIAELVVDAAQCDTEVRESVCKYHARFLGKNGDILSHAVLRQTPVETSRDMGDFFDSSAVKNHSALQQMVHINEILIRTIVGSQLEMHRGYSQVIVALREENDSLRQRERISAERVERLQCEQVEIEPPNTEAMDKLVNLAERMAPAIIGSIPKDQ